MDTLSLPTLFDWLQQNPLISLVFVFLVACGESLAVVGLVVPGALLMVGFGALIALDYLAFAPTVIAAMLGAIAGDGISYWLGVKYNRNLASIWPFTRYPDLLSRGEGFFQRHGGKSVLLGRFVGPLRPIIPAIAGMLRMPMRQFFLINILLRPAVGAIVSFTRDHFRCVTGTGFGICRALYPVSGRTVFWLMVNCMVNPPRLFVVYAFQ